jgi:AcrR family transcriptional regulator
MSTTDRRQQILDAALGSFLERGYLATTISDIRTASGASTGSIYHFFSGKGALADALLREAVAGWSNEVARELDGESGAEAGVKAAAGGLVRWGAAHPGHLRFMDEIRTLATTGSELASVRAMLAEGQAMGRQQYETWSRAGLVRALPWPVAHSLMLGPAYNYLRLTGPSSEPADDAAMMLAEAAWQAVGLR